MAFDLIATDRKPYIVLDSHVEVESHGTEGIVAEVFIVLDRHSDTGISFADFLQTANKENTIYSLNYRETGGQLFVKIEEDEIKIGIGLRR